ncbi:MAG TPA: PEGA domain-containing protein [Terriglobales bacterium]|nr:PEGA domain-containing protein [Terriglobales bacterium]
MPTKIGPFEILSELANSPTGAVYKANDPESGQTIALKAIQLSAFGENGAALAQALLAEAESTKALSSPNITNVYGAGEIEGQFCAAMEYVQGNSIATMLARKEGFTIWDLLDIGRQLSSGLDHAASHNVVHYSLEPAKIMCGWDGTVKILGYGLSSVGNFAHHVNEGLPTILHYMSPEQVQGQPTDGRSNLFSLGAMLYEMVTERRAFDRDDIESLRQSIVESTPVPPIHVNPKVHPLLSDLIMKALAKDPAQRYQHGRELLDDLEKCKESKPLAAKKAEPAKGTMAPDKAKAAAQSKFVTPAGAKPSAPAGATRPAAMASPASGLAKPATSAASAVARPVAKPAPTVAPKAAAAAAGVASGAAMPAAFPATSPAISPASSPAASPADEEIPELDLSNQFITASVKATLAAAEQPAARMSSAVADEPEIETFEAPAEDESPKIAVDPMMAEGAKSGGGGTSFSEISELPPLKEVYVAPPPPPPAPEIELVKQPAPRGTMFDGNLQNRADEKPKVQPREVAEKAIKEIKNVPPRLMLYSLGVAGALILAIGIGVTIYIHSQSGDDDAGAARPTPVAETPAETDQSAAQPAPQQAQATAPEETRAEGVSHPPVESARSRNARRKAAPAAPVIVPGQLAIDSTPQGAQVQVDGRTDPTWVTPFALTNLQPGNHSITVSKPGYSTDTRSIAVMSGNRASTIVHLAQLMATLIVKSNPAGANIYVDGRDVGARTPAQVSVDKGQHVVLVRMNGYLDETMNGQFVLGQTFNFSPTLRPLGNAESIHSVGKMSRLFGGKGVEAGQAVLSIHTQPKGAQIAINQHVMEKNSPLEVALDPGNYEIDITLSGYASIHKVINVDRGGKAVVDEVMQRQ